jgi:co-chaperonin GroES (HSP10)
VDRAAGLPERSPSAIGRIYQGWINLGPGDTRFVFCPGSALSDEALSASMRAGFAKMSADEARECEANSVALVVRAGDAVLFDQTVAHKVESKKNQQKFLRLHGAWRVSDDPSPLWSDEANNETIVPGL